MKDIYDGVCIGGQRHGQEMSSRQSMLRFPKLERAPVGWSDAVQDPATVNFSIEEYRHEELKFSDGAISFWRHESLANSFEALKFVFSLATRK